jgi:hypothetical protein
VVARFRHRETYDLDGTTEVYVFNDLAYQNRNNLVKLRYETCNDVVGERDSDNPFFLEFYSQEDVKPIHGHRFDGSIFDGSGYTSWHADVSGWAAKHEPTDFSDDPNDSDWAHVTASTNPSRPVVTPLTLLQDIVDLPKDLKSLGDLLKKPKKLMSVKELANANLLAQFGFLPLVDDVRSLLDFQSIANKRAGELQRLYDKGGLKRRKNLGTSSNTWEDKGLTIVSGQAGYWTGDFKRSTTAKRWATVRWKPTTLPKYDPKSPAFNKYARRIVGGMTSEGTIKGLWEIIPWSWLIDWFGNAGDFLLLNSNTVPAEAGQINVMTQITTSTQVVRTASDGWVRDGDGTAVYTTKRRDPRPASGFGHLPHLGADALSILSSLFIQRLK